jgi:hypothetical protein
LFLLACLLVLLGWLAGWLAGKSKNKSEIFWLCRAVVPMSLKIMGSSSFFIILTHDHWWKQDCELFEFSTWWVHASGGSLDVGGHSSMAGAIACLLVLINDSSR